MSNKKMKNKLSYHKNSKVDLKCTIIIPTYNRPDYLRRILSYYNKYGKNFNIIVADSSSNKNKKQNKEIVLSFSSLNIFLIAYPSFYNQSRKIADTLKHVEKKYCVLCADDDFITPNGIIKSVEILEKNPDLTVVHGRYISFWLNKKQFCWKPLYSCKSITFPDVKSRLNFHFSNYAVTTWYAVHKTDFLGMILKESLKFTNDVQFGELLLSMLTLVYGKMKCLDVLYSARENIPTSLGKTTKNLRDFIKDGTYNKKYNKFRECLSIHLSKKSQLDMEESKKLIDTAMSAYMKKYYANYVIKRIKSFPNTIRRVFWNIYISSPKYYDDLNRIRLHVLSHSMK
jgi:glycosyltransferase domain-containing protein